MKEKQNIEERIVRLVAIDKKYFSTPYMALPAKDEKLGTFLTGQHVDPSRQETRGNLTMEQMLGKAQITPEQQKKFGYIINPTVHIPLSNLMKFDLSIYENGDYVNYKDVQIFNFIRNYMPNVAANKSSVNPTTHHFYFENKESDAIEYIKSEDDIFEAEKLIRENCPLSEYRNKALLLNNRLKNFFMEVDTLSDNQIKAELLKVCKSNPKEVISCFGSKAEEDLYILKLVKYEILNVKDGSYFDGNHFVGDSIDKVRMFIKNPIGEGTKFASKWGRLIMEKEGKTPPQTMIPGKVTNTVNTDNNDQNTQDPKLLLLQKGSILELKQYAIDKKYAKREYESLDENQLRQYLIEKYQKSQSKK